MSAQGRSLTLGEIQLAKKLFKNAICYSQVKVHRKKYWLLQPEDTLITPNGHIYANGSYYRDDYARSAILYATEWKSAFIHEIAHVWQHQLRVLDVKAGGIKNTILTLGKVHTGYYYDLDAGKDLLSYSMEQQAAIIEDYYRIHYGKGFHYRRITEGSPRSKADYARVLVRFLHNPSYAKNYMDRYEIEYGD